MLRAGAHNAQVGGVGRHLLLHPGDLSGDDALFAPDLAEDGGLAVHKGHQGLHSQGLPQKGGRSADAAGLLGELQVVDAEDQAHVVQPIPDHRQHLVHAGALLGLLSAQDHGVAVAHGVGLGVYQVDAHAAVRVLLKELLPGHHRVFIGAGALGVDGHIDQVRHSLSQGALVQVGKHHRSQLGVGGDPRGGGQIAIEVLGFKVHAIPQFPVIHYNGEGEHLDVQLLPQRSGDVGCGVRDKLDIGHRSLRKVVAP